jgi:hypothetical protein
VEAVAAPVRGLIVMPNYRPAEEREEPPSWRRIEILSEQFAESEKRRAESEARADERHISNTKKLDSIEGKADLTNGRVKAGEIELAEIRGYVKCLLWVVIPIFLLVVGAFVTKVMGGK